MSPELGKRGNETVILMEVRWVKRAGLEWRSREGTYQGLTPFKTFYSCSCLGSHLDVGPAGM